MGLKEELGLPGAAYFVYDIDGGVHIGDLFGGTWCADRFDEETGDYQEAVPTEGSAPEPSGPDGLHSLCLEAALEDAE